MKILQLGKFYPIQGGVEKVMFDLLIGLSENYSDIECDMLCVSANGQYSKIPINKNATIYCAKLNKKIFSTMLSTQIIGMLKNMCNNYDIIHIHHPDPMVALALRLSNYKGKVILHWHSDIIKQKIIYKFYRPLQNWLINRADVIIGTTPKYIEESPHLNGTSTPMEVLPIGIAPIKFDIEQSETIRKQFSDKHIIFSLGRLVEYKGFKYLIDSAKYLPDDYLILIGGAGPLKDELSERIVKSNLTDKVQLLGRITEDKLPAYFGACDLFALSSIWKTEAFGIVQIEAMSCKKPVIATNIPESGVDWVNENGVSGINVPIEDPKALAQAIIDIISNQTKYQKFCEGAYRRFLKMFTFEGMITRCREIYENTLYSH